MEQRNEGVTLIELIALVAVMGVLLAIGAAQLNPSGAATRQAAQAIAASVNQARFEAVRTNNTAGLLISAGSGGASGTITLCSEIDETVAYSCSTGTTRELVDFSGGDLARAVIASPNSVELFFDRRGILRNPESSGLVITITDRGGGNVRTVSVLPTGSTEVN